MIKKRNRYISIAQRVSAFRDEVYTDDGVKAANWIVDYDKQNRVLIFQPVYMSKYMGKYVWSKADKHIVMSGSILSAKQFLRDAGLGGKDYTIIDIPGTFPAENKPIIKDYVGRMNFKSASKTLPKMVSKIEEIEERYPGEKIIVHCHSYYNAEYIARYLKLNRPIILQDRSNRIGSYNEWQKTDNGVFLSVAMNEGLNLVDDMCRCQIMIKMPFMSLSDKRVAKRLDNVDQLWYSLACLEAIVQAAGRAVRSKDDYADFYILDSAFEFLLNRYHQYLPKDFLDSIIEADELDGEDEDLESEQNSDDEDFELTEDEYEHILKLRGSNDDIVELMDDEYDIIIDMRKEEDKGDQEVKQEQEDDFCEDIMVED